jgi:predicted transcriptional regulator
MGILSTPTPKQQAREVIERLPDTATWDDVAQALAAEEGVADAKAGRLVEGESVMRWLESWGTDNEQPLPRP